MEKEFKFYSDEVNGIKKADNYKIGIDVWNAILALYNTAKNNDYFTYSLSTKDSYENRYFNEDFLINSLIGVIQDFKKEYLYNSNYDLFDNSLPETVTILDFIQFCISKIEDIKLIDPKFRRMVKLTTNINKIEFILEINTIFQRNQIIYKINENNNVEVILDEQINELIKNNTKKIFKDTELNGYLKNANEKIYNHNIVERKTALDKLYYAFERIKSIKNPNNKKGSIKLLINDISDNDKDLIEYLNKECNELTRIGNDYNIRHSETNKIPVNSHIMIELIFYRLYIIIDKLLKVID